MIYLLLMLPVILGFAIAQWLRPNPRHLQLFLSFSGAYLLSVTVLHLIPEVYAGQEKHTGIFILVGILLQSGLEYLSKGAEHGHMHVHDTSGKVPWLLLSSLFAHAFLEGMPLGLDTNYNLLWAIVVHKLPIAIILAVFLRNSFSSPWPVIQFLFLFMIMSPLGSWVSANLDWFQQYTDRINAIIIGVFLHISTAILFESSQNHQFNLRKFISILIGFGVGLLALAGT